MQNTVKALTVAGDILVGAKWHWAIWKRSTENIDIYSLNFHLSQ